MIAHVASFAATLGLIAFVGSATADPVEDAIRDKLAAALPDNLGVAHVFLPAALASADPSKLVVEPPRELRAGRTSIKILIRGKASWVPVSLAPLADVAVAQRAIAAGDTLTAADFSREHRALDEAPAPIAVLIGATATRELAAGSPIAAHDVTLPPALPRGTQVAVDVRHGPVHVKGSGVLELASRPGQPASVRLQFNKTVLRGVLVAPATVVVGDSP
jgi:flagella basal body P-ring formation protein FlgA